MRNDRGHVLRPILRPKAVIVLDDLHLPLQVRIAITEMLIFV